MRKSDAGRDRRVCLLTGASGTLGTAFCRMFADRYAIAAVHRERPLAVSSESRWVVDPLAPAPSARPPADAVFPIRADLEDPRDRRRVVELTLARFGGIDLLVNAAVHSVWAPLLDGDRLLASFRRQLDLNAVVPAEMALLVARMFWRDRDRENRARNRNVVNVSSLAGVNIYPGLGQSAYSASKAALNFFTCHLADEFEPLGVRANATAPNSFPSIITTEAAARSIATLDEGTSNGRILVVDADGERFV